MEFRRKIEIESRFAPRISARFHYHEIALEWLLYFNIY